METKNTKKSGNSKIAAIVLVRPQGCYWNYERLPELQGYIPHQIAGLSRTQGSIEPRRTGQPCVVREARRRHFCRRSMATP